MKARKSGSRKRKRPQSSYNSQLGSAKKPIAYTSGAASGIALLWFGWAMTVFFVVLWLTMYAEQSGDRTWQGIILLAMLGQCAIVTGIGLAVIDHVSTQRVRRRDQAFGHAKSIAVEPESRSTSSSSATEELLNVVAAAGRFPILYPDGTCEMHTRVGRRRFPTVYDAAEFLRARKEPSGKRQSVKHH